jgi:hypothetical protein
MNRKLIKAFLPAGIPSAVVVGFVVLALVAKVFTPPSYGEPTFIQYTGFTLGLGIFFVVCFAAYFLPATIAAIREKRNYSAILVLNVLGFLGVTWIIAIVWAFSTESVDSRSPST